MKKHALLSPSGASRWLACTPSAVWEQQFEKTTNEAADEGTFAHELSELYLLNHFKRIKSALYTSSLKKLKANKFFSAELNNHCVDFVAWVVELYSQYEEAQIFFEEQVDISEFIPEGFGHVDINMHNEQILHIVDLKYGKGVKVDAYENKQMMLYALGCLMKLRFTHDIKIVRMSIYQPRLENFGTYEMLATELISWAEEIVKPKAKLAYEGKGSFEAGAHCKFCRAKVRCKTLSDYNLTLAKHEFEDANKLTDADIAEILEKAPQFKEWLTAIQDYALEEATLRQKKWPGFKLVAGRSNRVYKDPAKIIAALKKAKFGVNLFLTQPQLISIGALEKNIGKDQVQKHCGKYIIKPEGSPALVPEWDKRPEINSIEKAKEVFKEV